MECGYQLAESVVLVGDWIVQRPTHPDPNPINPRSVLDSAEQGLLNNTNPKPKELPFSNTSSKCQAKSQDEEFDSLFGQSGKPDPVAAATAATSSTTDTGDYDDATIDNDNTESSSSAAAVTSNSGFSSMEGIPGPVLRQLTKMNIFEPTPIQKEAIPVALSGEDVMGLAQTGTGTGKTLAFGIPLVSKLLDGSDNDARRGKGTLAPKSVSALVLALTRELANQIGEQLRTLTTGTPIKGMVVFGGVRVQSQANKIKSGVHIILVASPGRTPPLDAWIAERSKDPTDDARRMRGLL